MPYFVYMIKTLNNFRNKTYVGYTKDIKVRLNKHNTNKGAKSTKGYIWEIIYKKRFLKKEDAMSYEYKLKNDRKKRSSILKKHNDKRN
tara:strand:+ start:303 stop:566 length:264 start_codon:yes stop_codon:yes gene_type:complete